MVNINKNNMITTLWTGKAFLGAEAQVLHCWSYCLVRAMFYTDKMVISSWWTSVRCCCIDHPRNQYTVVDHAVFQVSWWELLKNCCLFYITEVTASRYFSEDQVAIPSINCDTIPVFNNTHSIHVVCVTIDANLWPVVSIWCRKPLNSALSSSSASTAALNRCLSMNPFIIYQVIAIIINNEL